MAKLQYIRKDNTIFQANEEGGIAKLEDGTKILIESFMSINAAKRESRTLQLSNGGLGAGALLVH